MTHPELMDAIYNYGVDHLGEAPKGVWLSARQFDELLADIAQKEYLQTDANLRNLHTRRIFHGIPIHILDANNPDEGPIF